MRFTVDNVEAFYYNMRDVKMWYERNKLDDCLKYVCNGLEVLGFKLKSTTEPKSEEDKLYAIRTFLDEWANYSRAWNRWLSLQGESRDWYINAEIRDNRSKMRVGLTPITIKLLDAALSSGKVYDK